jgi:hypothetical protein
LIFIPLIRERKAAGDLSKVSMMHGRQLGKEIRVNMGKICIPHKTGLGCRAVRTRLFRIWLLALIAVWFGVVVPVHPRGAIQLGGPSHCAARTCCHPGGPIGHDSKPKPADPAGCAICHFLATLDLAPAMGMDVPPLGLVDELIHPLPQAAPVMALADPSSERGPPIA